MVWNNGDIYIGSWKMNKANGTGTFIDSQGSTYHGEWLDDLQHGFGREEWKNGEIRFAGYY